MWQGIFGRVEKRLQKADISFVVSVFSSVLSTCPTSLLSVHQPFRVVQQALQNGFNNENGY
jgi:hypothetical protein